MNLQLTVVAIVIVTNVVVTIDIAVVDAVQTCQPSATHTCKILGKNP